MSGFVDPNCVPCKQGRSALKRAAEAAKRGDMKAAKLAAGQVLNNVEDKVKRTNCRHPGLKQHVTASGPWFECPRCGAKFR